jgi:uncharacterized protein GlcG (DUF336 family)
MRMRTVRVLTIAAALALVAAAASAQLPPRKLGPFGDKPAGPQSLPGDNLPPFNMLGPDGKLVPMPKLEGPLHAPGGGPESTAEGPDLKTATRMAEAAVAACAAKGARVGAAVIDSAGEARAMLTADGSDGSHVFVAHRKALSALAFGTTSLQANADVWSGAAPMSKVTPEMFVMGGAVPIHRGGRLIGAIGVSGSAGGPPPGKGDEDCAYAGLRAGGPDYR